MSTVAPVSLSLLEGLLCRPGLAETVVGDALTRLEAARRISQWTARQWHARQRRATTAYSKERSNKRRKIQKKHKAKQTAIVVSTGAFVNSWEHWIFQALRSPSLPVRQVSLKVLLKGSAAARWQLCKALQELVDIHVLHQHTLSSEFAIQLVGFLAHLISEDYPWPNPVVGETDAMLTSFVASGGLEWTTRAILQCTKALLPQQLEKSQMLVEISGATRTAIELKLCLMVHLCHQLLLYSAVASVKEKTKELDTTLGTPSNNSKKRRQRALSECSKSSEKSQSGMDETKSHELTASRVTTLEHLHHYFWKCSSNSTNTADLSPLACVLCAYEMLREMATTKRASACLSILARILHPTATVTVVACEEAKSQKKKKTEAPSRLADVAAQQAVDALMASRDNDDVVMEDASSPLIPSPYIPGSNVYEESDAEDSVIVDQDEDDEEQEQADAGSEGGGNDNDVVVHEEDVDSEEDGDDDDEEVEEEGDDDFVIPRAEDDIANVVQQFERRMLDLSGSTGGSESEGTEGLTLDRGRLHKGSKVLAATEKDRNQTLIKSCMQVLAVQHPPAAAGMLHGSATQRSGQPKRRSPIALNRVLLSPSAEQSLIKRVCNIVKPPKKPLNLQVFMRRAPTQEEFFRGSITRNPIPISSLTQPGASSTEPTVRDLRQHIADNLQMSDSAELIELLVANQIMDLNLKLRVVQQVLWKTYLIDNSSSASARQPSASSFFGSGLSVVFSSSGGEATITGRNISSDTPLSALPPMIVTYRLAGVDGEATEEIVSTLEDPEAPSSSTSAEERERQMEKEYGMTRLVTEGRGISVLLRSVESDVFESLRRIRRDDVSRLTGRSDEGGSNPSRESFQQSQPCSALLLLRHCTQLASNRKKLLEAQAPTFLLRLLLDVLNSLDEASARAAAGLGQGEENIHADEAHAVTNPTADLLQELIETLASDISPELETALVSSAEVEEDAEEAASTLPLLLTSLRTIYLGPPMRKVIAKLLPFLTYGQTLLSRELASNFVTHVNIEALGEVESTGTTPTTRASVLMDTFIQAAISIPPSGVCNSLRSELKRCGFVDQLVSFILKDIPQSPPTWSAALWAKGTDFGGMKKDAIEKMWRSYFLRGGLQTAFKMLAGLCNGHEETQSAIANVGARKSAKGDVSFLTACHWLESTSDNSSLTIETKGVGILAETLLDELSSGNEKVSKKVKALRKETRDRKKEIAQESRSKTLVSLRSFGPMAGDTDQNRASAVESESNQSAVGLVGSVARRAASFLTGPPAPRAAKSPKKSDKSKPSWMEEMEAMEDETGLTCAICQEGRTLQPSELLGLYTFVKKVAIPCSKGGGRTHIDGSALLVSLPRTLPPSLVNTNVDHEWFRPARIAADTIRESTDVDAVMAAETTSANRRMTALVTSVSAGNAIHCSCHSKARAADRNHSRAPKSEWEGASLRNSRVQCNSILPLVSSKSSKVSLMAVDLAMSEQQNVIANILGAKPRSDLWLVLHDVRMLLMRFAYGEALNADCGGGSLSSNAALVMYQLCLADMFSKSAEHEAPHTAQHARFLSSGFLAATNLIRANDFDTSGSTATALMKGIADGAPMASLCCILFSNNVDEESDEPEKGDSPHPRRRWALEKEEFLRGLLACAGRRHSLNAHDSGCVNTSRNSRSSRVRSRSFNEWDLDEETASRGTGVPPSRRKSILGKRGLPQIDEYAKALRPMVTLYAIFDQLSADFVVGMDDEAVEASASRLAEVVSACQKSKDIHELLVSAKVTLDHEEIVDYLQKGMDSVSSSRVASL